MIDISKNKAAAAQAPAAEIDQGLRAYMLGIYNYMAAGLVITGIVAYLASVLAGGSLQTLTGFGEFIYLSWFKWVVILAPLAMIFSFAVSLTESAARTRFWIFAALMGLSMSSIFLIYTDNSITRVFFITAAAFGGLSLYGYTTQRDLSGWGSFLIMGLIGLIIASVVNLFIGSSALMFAISVIGVLVFAGLTAYDTQRLKDMYCQGTAMSPVLGALHLYLNFVNMFMMLLHLFGERE